MENWMITTFPLPSLKSILLKKKKKEIKVAYEVSLFFFNKRREIYEYVGPFLESSGERVGSKLTQSSFQGGKTPRLTLQRSARKGT